MAEVRRKGHFHTEIRIAGGEEIGRKQLKAFEWKSFINGGYVIRAKITDPNLRYLRQHLKIRDFLRDARRKPTEVKFKMLYPDASETEERTAFITDLDIYGITPTAAFEFVAVDPPTWYLNAGKGDGKVYTGNVSKVIEDVVKEFAPGITPTVTKTNDDENGKWAMMRQDPKTFIQSLLDWSSELTPKKTNWMVASKDREIFIQEQFDFQKRGKNLNNYNASPGGRLRNDILDFAVLGSTFLTAYQNKMTSQGISTVSGKFVDKQTDRNKVLIDDLRTAKKLNTRTDQEKAFKKPDEEWATSIQAVPELSAGELGIKYEDYLAGRARNLYISSLPMIMRVRLTVDGDTNFHDNALLGASTININWKDHNGEDFFLSGKWIVYGFHHRMAKGQKPHWFTDVYIYRLDFDAASVKVG